MANGGCDGQCAGTVPRTYRVAGDLVLDRHVFGDNGQCAGTVPRTYRVADTGRFGRVSCMPPIANGGCIDQRAGTVPRTYRVAATVVSGGCHA